jgi:CO/xanthine dehydrogenase FAD-binding subunit
MKPFTYTRATTVEEAVKAIGQGPGARFIGGGTNLLDLMKMGVEQPSHLIDITRLPLTGIEERNGGVRIGADVTNTDAANHALVRTRYPVLSEAILAGASPQLRNMATMGGNLMQPPAAITFTTRPTRNAINASRAADARRKPALTASTPFWARATYASPRTPVICALLWRRLTRWSKWLVRTASDLSR